MRRWALPALCLAASAGAQQASVPVTAPPPRLAPGYLAPGPMPDSELLSPPPPAPGSTAEARDLDAARAGLALRSTSRWTLATSDADVFGASETHAFSCAAGVTIDRATTPRTWQLLRTTIADLGLATQAIKRRYQRPRPVHGRWPAELHAGAGAVAAA